MKCRKQYEGLRWRHVKFNPFFENVWLGEEPDILKNVIQFLSEPYKLEKRGKISYGATANLCLIGYPPCKLIQTVQS